MRSMSWIVSLGLTGLLTGCVIAIGDGRPPPPDHFEVQWDHGRQCTSIQMAAAVSFSSDRAEVLAAIAARTDLTEHEQLFLIDTVVETGGFSSDVTDVLVALAGNPVLTLDAREWLVRREVELDLFSSDKRRLADALAGGPTAEG